MPPSLSWAVSIFGLPADVITTGTFSSMQTLAFSVVISGLPMASGKLIENGLSDSSRKRWMASRSPSGGMTPSMQPSPPALETTVPSSGFGVMPPMISG